VGFVDGVGAINPAGDDDADRGALFFHRPDLHGAGLGSQEVFAIPFGGAFVGLKVKVVQGIASG